VSSKPNPAPRFTKLELQVLEALWTSGKASIREIHEAFPEPRPAYTTVQTMVNRLEGKNAVRRVRKISNAHIYEALVARDAARHRLLDDILGFFGGRGRIFGSRITTALPRASASSANRHRRSNSFSARPQPRASDQAT
jgi:predicted transcriptional regulator